MYVFCRKRVPNCNHAVKAIPTLSSIIIGHHKKIPISSNMLFYFLKTSDKNTQNHFQFKHTTKRREKQTKIPCNNLAITEEKISVQIKVYSHTFLDISRKLFEIKFLETLKLAFCLQFPICIIY